MQHRKGITLPNQKKKQTEENNHQSIIVDAVDNDGSINRSSNNGNSSRRRIIISRKRQRKCCNLNIILIIGMIMIAFIMVSLLYIVTTLDNTKKHEQQIQRISERNSKIQRGIKFRQELRKKKRLQQELGKSRNNDNNNKNDEYRIPSIPKHNTADDNIKKTTTEKQEKNSSFLQRWLFGNKNDKNYNDDEEMIDMRELNYQLAFDNPDGGVWKQGWDVQPSNKKPLHIYVIPHSHCDPGWIKTFDEYFQKQTKQIITTIINALLKDVRRKFIWAEISYFSWWWDEQDISMRQNVIKLLNNKQLEFVTGGWVQPDEANSELYAMEIQLQEGHDWIRTNLGEQYVPEYGWSIDPFGYSSTAAYLWKKYNFKGMLIQRVHYAIKKELAKRKHLEFYWRQTWDYESNYMDMDNGQHIYKYDIYTHVMPFFSYDIPHTCGPDPSICCQFDFARLPVIGQYTCPWHKPPKPITDDNIHERSMLLLDQYRKKATLYRSNAVLIPLGDDFRYQTSAQTEAQYTNYQKIFDYINENVEDVHIQWGTLSEYFHTARQTFNGPVPILKGSFFTYSDVNEDYWSGYFTSRVFDKALDRQLERILYAAESLGGTKTELQIPRRELSLFQHHDGVTGTAKNHVVEDYAKRMFNAINYTQQWILNKYEKTIYDTLEIKQGLNIEIRPCLIATEPRTLSENLCRDDSVIVYNPLSNIQICNGVKVLGEMFAKVTLPCEIPGAIISSSSESLSKFVFDPDTGLMVHPIKEEWKSWHVNKGGAYLFFPGTEENFNLHDTFNEHSIEKDGYIVKTKFWNRTVIQKQIPSDFGTTATVIDFIYETNLKHNNQEWFARFTSSDITNNGYFHTDLNGFNFDTHHFRNDMPIQSQVFPMPTLASIQDDKMRMTIISEHAQGTASLSDGTIDIWLDRRLKQDDNRGLGQGVQDNRRTRTRLRVVLQYDGYDPNVEFDITPLERRMWDEVQHPLVMFGIHKEDSKEVRDVLSDARRRLKGDGGKDVIVLNNNNNIPNKETPKWTQPKNDPIQYQDVTLEKYTVNNTIVPFVFLVYKRVDYFQTVINSLRKSDFPKERIPIIVSVDGHIPEMNDYVQSLRNEFKLIHLIHEHSCHDHPNTFPGNDTSLILINETRRDWWVTCCKHHFTWVLRTVFSLNSTLFQEVDTFLFLEEDYVVAPTIYTAVVNGLNAMAEYDNDTTGGFMGLGFDPTYGNSRNINLKRDPQSWYAAAFLSGPMTLNRDIFDKIQEHATTYCGQDGFEDYNWDWSFVHMQNIGVIPYTLLMPFRQLVRHIGIEGGMHAHKKNKAYRKMSKEEFETLTTEFYGTRIKIGLKVGYKKFEKGWGGWNHPRDHDHCLQLLTNQTIIIEGMQNRHNLENVVTE